ncbi:MAG: hypothetical protein ACOY40_02770 [Bacillota bacterium]
MGDKYIYDIVEQYVPDHLISSLKTSDSRAKYEVLSAALEKYFRELGVKTGAGRRNRVFLSNYLQTWEKDGFNYQYQRVRLESQI